MAAVLAATDKEAANARGVVFQNQCVVRRPVYASIIESNRYLFREVNGAYRVHLWFSPNELIGGTNCQVRVPAWTVGQPLIFGGVDSLMPSDEMPNTVASVPIDALKVLNPRAEVVAVISQTSTPAVELAEKLSKSSDSTWRVLQSKKVAHGPVAFLISIIGDAQEARAGAQHL